MQAPGATVPGACETLLVVALNTSMTIDASKFEPLLNRLLNLTDQAWEAHTDGRSFEYKRVENDVEALLKDLSDQTVAICGSEISFAEFADIVQTLGTSPRTSKYRGSRDAFENLVKVVRPLSREGVALDTAKRR